MSLLELLYPQTCYFCGEISKRPICDKCKKEILYVKEPRCKKCGKPVRYVEQEFCTDCKNHMVEFEQGRSVWLHKGPVAWSVYQFKYKNRRVYAEFYAEDLVRLYGKKIKEWGIEVIVPVPLHWRKRRIRGYNQAEVLAKLLGRKLGIPVNTKAIRRIRYTNPQKELNPKDRKKNLMRAFCTTKKWKRQANVLVIDDIYTTGNTIDAVAKELKKNGVIE